MADRGFFSGQIFQVLRGLEVSFFRSSLCQRGKIDSLWLILVLFHRLKGKCCWVCRISLSGFRHQKFFLGPVFQGFHGYCISVCQVLRCWNVPSGPVPLVY